MKINHPLMHNNFLNSDMNAVRKLIRTKNLMLTQSKKVLEFEKKWSKWLGVKYSVFVNSGSSANFISMLILRAYLQKKKEIIVPTLTWVSDINSVIMSGFKPVFVDIDPKNLSMNEDQVLKKINKNTLAVFITHVQGFNGLSEKILKKIKNKKVMLIEDVCESHGATFKNKKLGTFGLISNFSFIMLTICLQLRVAWYAQTIKRFMKRQEFLDLMECFSARSKNYTFEKKNYKKIP